MVHLLLFLQTTLVVLLWVGLRKVVLPLGAVGNAWLRKIQPDRRLVYYSLYLLMTMNEMVTICVAVQ
jgi:hypothetical protein